MTTTAILLSGGVDSLTAAHLLKRQGHKLVGIHFFTGFEAAEQLPGTPSSPDAGFDVSHAASRRAAALSEQLDIPIATMDCRQAFKTGVVDYFTRTYAQGKTPNPCLVCNPVVKFGLAFDHARKLGAETLATGHYARILVGRQGGCRLLKARDRSKDQSYFLARLSQEQLRRTVFPLGEMTKEETIRMARENGLSPLTPGESQDICFIREGRYGEFLERQPGFKSDPGPIKDARGKLIGRHPGLHLFTIGQRRGINCPASEPYYVIAIDAPKNTLVVGLKEDTLAAACRVEHINWILEKPSMPRQIKTKLRYRHKAADSHLSLDGDDRVRIRFAELQSAVTPGQGAVFYNGDEVLGGGWIV